MEHFALLSSNLDGKATAGIYLRPQQKVLVGATCLDTCHVAIITLFNIGWNTESHTFPVQSSMATPTPAISPLQEQ